MGYYKELVIQVCELYARGVSIDTIHTLTDLSFGEIETILNQYAGVPTEEGYA